MQNSSDAIVILGGGILQRPLIEAALARGRKVFLADQNPNALCRSLVSEFIPIENNDPQKLVQSLMPLKGQFSSCATLGTDMSFFVASVNDAFGLRGLNKAQALVTTDKGAMRAFLLEHHFVQPAFIVVSKKEEAILWMQANPTPGGYVIKPVSNMGARGVMWLGNVDDLGFGFEYASAFSRDSRVILEEFIEAHELSVDALVVKGEVFITGLADRIIERKDGRFFIETGHTMPTACDSKVRDLLHAELTRFAEALSGLANAPYTGALKGDVRWPASRIQSETIVFGEIASRLSGGFMSTHTYPYSTGHSLVDAYLDLLEGKLPEILRRKTNEQYKRVVLERAIIAEPGKVDFWQWSDPGSGDLGPVKIHDVFVHKQPGDLIFSLQNNVGKLANFILSGPSLEIAEATWKNVCDNYLTYSVSMPLPDQRLLEDRVLDQRLLENRALDQRTMDFLSRQKFNPAFCRVCRVCDGNRCVSGVPGMGGIGSARVFKKNHYRMQNYFIKINPDANRNRNDASNDGGIRVNDLHDISITFANKNWSSPIFIAPITGAFTNMGGSITEYDYAMEVSAAAKLLNIPVLLGDGASPDKYFVSLEAIRHHGGYLVIKPRKNHDEIIKRIQAAEKAGADGWGMDIDSVKLVTMKNRGQEMAEKSLEDLKLYGDVSKLPFFIKGVMSVTDAEKAALAGASSIIVSNHGGRIDDTLPATIDVVSEISVFIKTNFPGVGVFADGGIRSGLDALKMIALGADGVLVGRPIAIAAVGLGRIGVHSLLSRYTRELKDTLTRMGIKDLDELNETMVGEVGQ